MEKHLLLTISNDQETSSNLRFIRHFFDDLCDVRLTLFYVAPRPPDWRSDPAHLAADQQAVAQMEQLKQSSGKKALDKARRWIVQEGCEQTKVHTKIVPSKHGVVSEIIQEAHRGKYDACVLGRRGVSWFGELLEDSVSHKILWEEIDFPVWICRRPETGLTRNVLLATDGSDSSLRMADHVGFMLGGSRKHTVVMYHVIQAGKEGKDPKDIFTETRKALVEGGLQPDLINEEVVETKDVAEAILKRAKSGHFSTVAMGRAAGAPGAMDRLFPGSVSSSLLRRMEDFALWISK